MPISISSEGSCEDRSANLRLKLCKNLLKLWAEWAWGWVLGFGVFNYKIKIISLGNNPQFYFCEPADYAVT